MRRSSLAIVATAALALGTLVVHAQQRDPAPASSKGVNIGSLTCKVAGGAGFVFGSTKALDCIFTRTDGSGERYVGDVRRFGIDIGYTEKSQIVWLVFAPGNVTPGALAGSYAGATVQGAVVVGVAANILVGGNSGQVTLQPVSVEGSTGVNVAGGMAEIVLKPAQVVRGSPMRTALMLACFAAACAYAQQANAVSTRWEIEQGVEVPSYAVAEPTATDLNIDTVVLGCEQSGKGRGLQLQLYLSDDGRLRPIGVSPAELADDPRASISIDGKQYPVALMFADDHVLLADGLRGAFPRLSDHLIEAMQTGRTMILQFELVAPRPGRPAGFDSKATVDLETAGASEAIAAMKRCVGVPGPDA